MTVEELIERLRQFDPELPVMSIGTTMWGYFEHSDQIEVELAPMSPRRSRSEAAVWITGAHYE